MANSSGKIGIVGSGIIGKSWAMLFASVACKVVIYDIKPKQIEAALTDIKQQLQRLEQESILRGTLNASEQFDKISGTNNLSEAINDAVLVQECVPENLDLKREVWKQIDDIAGPNTILASSTSSFMPSIFSEHLKNRENFIVSHPVNPPYYIPLVEVVPASWTNPEVVKKTRAIMEEIGQAPVVLNKEISGFALNRIQVRILNEVWNLVKDGVLDAKDVDKVMSQGLGMRYAFLGPLETTHLNAEGFSNYCERYSDAIYAISKDFKPLQKIEGPLVHEIYNQLLQETPLDNLEERRNWRDLCLEKLSLLKKEMHYKK